MPHDPDYEADLRRYPPRPFFREQSAWAVAVYRFGRRNDRRPAGLVRRLGRWRYALTNRVVETLTGITLPKSARVGPGLRIHHFGNIVVHKDAVLGANCTLRQGVTIGSRVEGGPVPVLEDDVDLGAYAQILGGVRIGKGAKIGAMSVVLCDVPAGATAVGVPARVIFGGDGGRSGQSHSTRMPSTPEAELRDAPDASRSTGGVGVVDTPKTGGGADAAPSDHPMNPLSENA